MPDQEPRQTQIEPRSQRQRSVQRPPEEQVGLLRGLYERAVLTWKLLWDRRVGFWPKLIPFLGLVYLLSPVDLLPELLVGALGPLVALDDIGVATLVLNLFVQAAPPDVVSEYLREMRGRRFSPDDEDVIDSTAEEVDW
ncbi:MAG TPA: YkvA family protein [Aggregatilineales bacterium]|nr:YkvA family protein [Aggregatilineales bacterium]